MTLLQRIKQRYRDFIHEGAIRRVQEDIVRLERDGCVTSGCYVIYLKLADLDRELASLIAKRSPSQLKRMGVDSGKV